MSTKAKLLRRFAILENERQILLTKLEQLDPVLLQTAPGPEEWSVAQVMLHLAIAEGSAMAYLRKKLEVGGHGPPDVTAPLRLLLLNTALALPIKFKAPAIVATVPACTYADARAQWDAVRSDMRHVLDGIPEKYVGHGLFKHPSAGKFDLVQGLRFMTYHVRHHHGQIQRILGRLTT